MPAIGIGLGLPFRKTLAGVSPVAEECLLLQDGTNLLLQDGGCILLNSESLALLGGGGLDLLQGGILDLIT
jgi:hypothetical protein